jgi:hypothetical protein
MYPVLLENWFSGILINNVKDYQRLSKTIVCVAANRFVALFMQSLGLYLLAWIFSEAIFRCCFYLPMLYDCY